MSKQLKEMREKAGRLAKRMGEMRDTLHKEQRSDWTADEKVEWDRINEEYDGNGKLLEIEERVAAVLNPNGADIAKPGRDDFDGGKVRRNAGAGGSDWEIRSKALAGWIRDVHGKPVLREQKEAARQLGINIRGKEFAIPLATSKYNEARNQIIGEFPRPEHRAMSVLKMSAGGGLVPEGFMRNFEVALLAYGQMRDACDIFRTAEGNPIPWPTTNDTTNKATLITENATVSETDVTVGQVTFNAYKFTSNIVNVPVELMEDSAFDLAATLSHLLGIRMARGLNDYYTTGSGASQPKGIVTASTTFSAASANAIAADDLIGLEHSVDPLYRSGACFMMHDSIIKALRQLKDGFGRYLWSSGLQDGRPDTLSGYRVFYNQSMDSTISSGKKTVLFGQTTKFKIREVATLRLRRLVERYADQDQEAFVAFMRADSNLLDAGTHPVKVLAH